MALLDRPQEEQFPAKEAAKRLGISVKLLLKHVKAGTIRFINVAGPGASRPSYRFTDYMLKQFQQSKQQPRREQPCQSTKAPKARSTATTFKSAGTVFTALPTPKTKRTLKPQSAN